MRSPAADGGKPHPYDCPEISRTFNIYIHDRYWQEGELIDKATARIRKSMQVAAELTTLLRGRTYASTWEI